VTEAAELPSSSNSVATTVDANERVRCNGGEAMVDCAADVYWLSDDAAKVHGRRSRIRDGSPISDVADINIIAKAKLQEKGQYYKRGCSVRFM